MSFVKESSWVGRLHLPSAPGAGTWSWASTRRQDGRELLGLSRAGRPGASHPTMKPPQMSWPLT